MIDTEFIPLEMDLLRVAWEISTGTILFKCMKTLRGTAFILSATTSKGFGLLPQYTVYDSITLPAVYCIWYEEALEMPLHLTHNDEFERHFTFF